MATTSGTKEAPDRWEVFLEKLRRVPDRLSALDAAGISRGELTIRLDSDDLFLEAYRKAYEDGLDSMEDEAVRRAVLGVVEPVVSQGMIVTHRIKYSDGLLQFFLQAQRAKFRGSNDGEVLRPLTEEARAKMAAVFAEGLEEIKAGHSAPAKAAKASASKKPEKKAAKKPEKKAANASRASK